MSTTQTFQLLVFYFAALFPLVNPFDTVPLFLAVTRHRSARERAATALRACIFATSMMVVTLFVGHAVLVFLGVSLSAVRITGGLISMALGFQMLFLNQSINDGGNVADRGTDADYALMPIAFPSLCGAGVLAVLMSMSARISESPTVGHAVRGYVMMIAVVLVVGFLSWIILRSSIAISNRLGQRGIDALAKLMGIVLISIGVQLIGNGVMGFIDEPPRAREMAP